MVLHKSDGGNTKLIYFVPILFNINRDYNIKIIASKISIKVYFKNSETPQINTTDKTYHSGQVRLRAINSAADFSNISASEIYENSNKE